MNNEFVSLGQVQEAMKKHIKEAIDDYLVTIQYGTGSIFKALLWCSRHFRNAVEIAYKELNATQISYAPACSYLKVIFMEMFDNKLQIVFEYEYEGQPGLRHGINVYIPKNELIKGV